MKARILAAAGLSLVAAASARAQANSCPRGTATTVGGVQVPDRQRATEDACQMAVDIYQLMSPQLGTALAGGNATLGRGGPLGGLPHFSLGVRVNAVAGDIPDFANFPAPNTDANGRQQRELPTKTQAVPMPTVDAAIGIFKGLPLGITNVGGIDVLVNATYLPTIGSASDDFQLEPDKNLQIGYGVRVGVLQESLLLPGVSATYMRRDLPTATLYGRSTDFDVTLTDYTVKTSAWRLVASKSLLLFGLAAGVGQDSYEQSATIQAQVKDVTLGSPRSDAIPLVQDLTRTNMFLDLSMNLPAFKLVGEVGQVSGGTVDTYNTFSGGRADKSRLYGSVGLRFGF